MSASGPVAQVVVVAGIDVDGLEKALAFVMLKKTQVVSKGDLVSLCRDELPSLKRPRRVVSVTEYRTTATGKIHRIKLHALAPQP